MSLKSRVAAAVLDGTTLARKILDRELRTVLAGATARTVLDVGGAGGQRYRRLIDSRTHWTVDIQHANRPTVVGDAHALPIADESVDCVLSLQMLEHCVQPHIVVQEAHRVLAPGGRLVLATVLLYELHASPHDYYRFTESALHDLTSAFAEVRIHPLGNRFTAAYDLTLARSLVLNSLLGRLAFTLGSAPSSACPTGFVVDARKR